MQPAISCQTLSILFLWYSTQAPFFPWEASINLSPFHQQTSKSSCDPGTRKHMKTLYITILVGGFNHLEKYEFVNGKDDIPYSMEKQKPCSKPPTSILYIYIFFNTWTLTDNIQTNAPKSLHVFPSSVTPDVPIVVQESLTRRGRFGFCCTCFAHHRKARMWIAL